MGRTVESYRMALEDEIRRWKGFSKALRTEDKESFEALMDAFTIPAEKVAQVREGVRCNQASPCSRSALKVGFLMFTLRM